MRPDDPLDRPVEVRGSYATPEPTQRVACRPSDVLAALDDEQREAMLVVLVEAMGHPDLMRAVVAALCDREEKTDAS